MRVQGNSKGVILCHTERKRRNPGRGPLKDTHSQDNDHNKDTLEDHKAIHRSNQEDTTGVLPGNKVAHLLTRVNILNRPSSQDRTRVTNPVSSEFALSPEAMCHTLSLNKASNAVLCRRSMVVSRDRTRTTLPDKVDPRDNPIEILTVALDRVVQAHSKIVSSSQDKIHGSILVSWVTHDSDGAIRTIVGR